MISLVCKSAGETHISQTCLAELIKNINSQAPPQACQMGLSGEWPQFHTFTDPLCHPTDDPRSSGSPAQKQALFWAEGTFGGDTEV